MEARESRNVKMEGVDTINLFFNYVLLCFLKNLRLVNMGVNIFYILNKSKYSF